MKKPMIMFEPDDAGWNGEADPAPTSATYDPWAPKPDEPAAPAEPSAPTEPAAPTPPVATIDPKAFEAFGKSFGETFAKTQAATQPAAPPTPEQVAEARKALKFFEIDDNFLKDFDNLETKKASLERFRDGITQHIITVMNHLRANDQTEFNKIFDERLTPLQALVEERQNTEKQNRFNSRFPQFAKPEVAPMIGVTIANLASQKAFEGKTEAEGFKLVADQLALQARSFNPNFVLEDAGNGAPPQTRTTNSLPVTSHGSGQSRSSQPGSANKNWALAHMK